MELDKIIDAAKEKELGSDVIAAIKALDNSGEIERLTKELDSEKGKAKGILEDKKRYKAERDEHKTALNKIETDKLPTEEQHAKALKDMQDKIDKSELDRKADADNFAKVRRDASVSDLTGSINWTKSTPADTRKLIVKNALSGIEDLSDKAKVAEVMKSLTESHAGFISADAASGTGADNNKDVKIQDEKTPTLASATADAWKQK